MLIFESDRLFVIKSEHRTAEIKKGVAHCEGQYVVYFYYDGLCDYEWKRGAHGTNCEICDTLEQAKRKAKYYIDKDKEVRTCT